LGQGKEHLQTKAAPEVVRGETEVGHRAMPHHDGPVERDADAKEGAADNSIEQKVGHSAPHLLADN
jgi:hypothetical protein